MPSPIDCLILLCPYRSCLIIGVVFLCGRIANRMVLFNAGIQVCSINNTMTNTNFFVLPSFFTCLFRCAVCRFAVLPGNGGNIVIHAFFYNIVPFILQIWTIIIVKCYSWSCVESSPRSTGVTSWKSLIISVPFLSLLQYIQAFK